MTASRRSCAKAPRIGPSITRRTSRTLPRLSPRWSNTSQSRRSLRRIVAASGDVADDVVAGPALGGEGGEVVGVDGEVDGDADVADAVVGDAAGVVERGPFDVRRELAEPGAGGAAARLVQQVAGSGEDRGDVPGARVGLFELEVVDLAAQHPVAVAQLAVEEVQCGVVHPPGRPVHAPAFVMIINGMVATATTTRI